ncbi:hypothetical protein BDR26DRAFT_879364 [Obelidium mucronatum]|nr:hypothetical protein BDR26DRAFT_879364 [Obelidium mucronatum]
MAFDAADMTSFMSTSYSHGFWTCFTDIPTCCGVWCCPCLMVGLTSGKLHKNNQFDIAACLCSGIGAYRIRRKVQSMFGIQESEDATVCATACCGTCSLVQDIREMNKRSSGTAPQPQMTTA